MFGKKNFTNTQIRGRIANPDDDILIDVDNNNLALYSKYKKGSENRSNKSVMKFRDELDDIKLFQSGSGLLDYNGKSLSTENKHLEDGLVLWIDKLIDNSSGYDKSGSGNSLTISNMSELDGVLNFNGSTSNINAGSSVNTSSGNLSISCWVKPSTALSDNTIILGKVNTSSSTVNDWKLWADNSDSWAFSSNNGSIHNSSVKLSMDNWSHITATFDSTNNLVRLYTNGSLSFSNTETASISSTQPLIIGNGNSSDNEFTGYMKDIRVYNRIIETNEVLDLYNLGAVDIKDVVVFSDITLPTPNIYLKMTEGVSSKVLNYGNYATKTGTITNATWGYINNKSAILFDGIDDYVALNNDSNIDLNDALTISFWVYPYDNDNGSVILSKHFLGEFDMKIQSNNNTFIFYNGNSDGAGSYETWSSYSFTSILSYEKWNHFTLTRDTGAAVNKNIKIYINGIYLPINHTGGWDGSNNTTDNFEVKTTTNNINIGARDTGTPALYTQCNINNLRIYNSELTEKQIQKIYYEELQNINLNYLTDTANNLKTITTLTNPETNSTLNENLIFNLTGQDDTSTTYVTDYSLNRYHANVADGTLSYTTTGAGSINATKTLSFNGDTYLEFDGTRNNGFQINTLNGQFSFNCWSNISSIAGNNPLITLNKDNSNTNVYSSYIDTAGNITLIRANTTNDLLTYNTNLSTNTWYYITVNNYVDRMPEVFYGSDNTSPVKADLVNISASGTTYVSNNNLRIANGLDTSGSPGSNLSGKLDDIKLYSRVLTESEILANWNNGDVNYFTASSDSNLLIKLNGEPGNYNVLNNENNIYSSFPEGNTLNSNGFGSENSEIINDLKLHVLLNEGTGTTVTDLTNNYNDGTINNGALWSDKNTINFDNSIYFDGVDDNISVTNNTSVNLSDALTISMWFNSSNTLNRILASKDFDQEFDIRLNGYSQEITFYNGSSSLNFEAWTANNSVQGLSFTNNLWYHLCITRSNGTINKTVFTYLNGIKYEPENIRGSFAVTSSTTNITIGSRFNNSTYFNGYISDFRIYDRELSHTEILDLYNNTFGYSSLAKYGNFSYNLNPTRDILITTSETSNLVCGELWFKTNKFFQQTIFKSNYGDEDSRANGDIKLELVHADSNNSNLIANWNCFASEYGDGELKDYTGNGTNVTIVNFGSSDMTNGLNLNNSILEFDGTTSYGTKNLENTNFLSSINNGSSTYIMNFSCSAWVYCTNVLSTRAIFATKTKLIDGGVVSINIQCLIIASTRQLRFQTRNNISRENYDTNETIPLNQWTHVAFVFNNTTKKKVYINGVLATSSSTNNDNISIILNTSDAALFIGSYSTVPENPFIGNITDLRIYNKALSQSEIQTVMQQTMKPELSIKLGGSTTTVSNNNVLISPNVWNHLAFNYNRDSNYLKLYMNGDLVASDMALTNTTAMNCNINLGNQKTDGYVNNFNLYSRNLTNNEIKNIYLGLNRLKIHLNPVKKIDEVIIYNKAPLPIDSYIRQSNVSITKKDTGFTNVLSFSESSNYITLDPENDVWRNRSFTHSMWIKPSSSGSGTKNIFTRGSSTTDLYYIKYDYDNNELDFLFSSTVNSSVVSLSNIIQDVYTHITVSCSYNIITIYINGVLTRTVNIVTPLNITISSSIKTVIGSDSSASNNYVGYIYDYRYYDTDLTAEAIRSIYSGYDLNTSINSKPELTYETNDKTVVRNKDYVQPAKSSLVLHLNNYTTGSVIASSSENGITGTGTSMVSSTSEYNFNGSNSYITISNQSDLNISSTALTLSMWVNPDTLASGTYRLLMKGSTDDYGLYINSSDKAVFNLTSSVTATSTTVLTAGTWYHITATFNGSTMKVYINGTDDSASISGEVPANVPNSGTGIYLGATTTPDNYYDGKMRDIRIYNSALSTDAIKMIYNAGLTTTGEFSIAANKEIEGADKYVFVSKYLVDNNGETTDVLGKIARDSLIAHYTGSNTGTTLLDQSTLAISDKMTSLRPSYLASDKLISYSQSNAVLSSSLLISAGTGTINSNSVLLNGNTTSNLVITGGEDNMVGEWSFSTWYKLTSPSSKNVFLSRKETSKNFDIFIDSSDNEFKFKYNTTTVSSNLAIDTNDYDWHHFAVTKGQEGLVSNVISFYHDGELVNQKKQDIAFTTSATSLTIGTDGTTGFNGYLDDIKLYSTRLNDVEVGKLARGETISGPVHYWMMEDDTTGTTVRDLGSAGNNLRLQGAGTTWDTTTSNVYYGSRSINFNGTSTSYASSASTGVLGAEPRCIGMWFKRAVSTDDTSELLTYGNSSTAGEQFSVIINTSSNIQVNIGSTSNVRATTRVNNTNWHHLTVLQLPNEYYSDDRSIKIFIDGNECTDTSSYTETEINTRITGTTDLLRIGKDFNGVINEVKMYNYSLSQPELDILYANKNQYMINLG